MLVLEAYTLAKANKNQQKSYRTSSEDRTGDLVCSILSCVPVILQMGIISMSCLFCRDFKKYIKCHVHLSQYTWHFRARLNLIHQKLLIYLVFHRKI